MSTEPADRFRRAARLLPVGIAMLGVFAIGVAGAIAVGAAREATRREELQVYHMQSQGIAQRIVVDAGRLRQLVTSGSRRRRNELLYTMGEATDRLVEIQRTIWHADTDPAVDRLRLRFDRVEAALSRGVPSGEAGRAPLLRAIDSLELAAEQLDRLHSISIRHEMDALGARAVGQLRIFLLGAALLAAAAFGISRWLAAALKRSFEREQAVLAASRAQLAHSQKIEALGRLSGGVAHDFNNLLTVILGNLELLRMRLPADSPLQQTTQEIEAAGEQAASLARRLLAFSRRDVAEVQSVDLNELVRQSESMLARVLRKDIALVTDLDPALGPVLGDPTQLQQVVLNLVLNGRDALGDGGTLTIRTSLEHGPPAGRGASGVPTTALGSCACLSVRDDGTGIPPEILDRMFDPYFTTKPKGDGTGLGLATVLSVVEESGGSIVVDSTEGKGSQFDVYLPLASDEPIEHAEDSPVVVTGGTETVLVAEDQPDLRALTTRMLREAGFEVLSAEDGASALRICEERAEPIDLILTDVVMPNVKGLELAERAKHSHPEARVLFMSGYADEDALLADLRGSPERLLTKPFRRDQLLERVRTILGSGTTG